MVRFGDRRVVGPPGRTGPCLSGRGLAWEAASGGKGKGGGARPRRSRCRPAGGDGALPVGPGAVVVDGVVVEGNGGGRRFRSRDWFEGSDRMGQAALDLGGEMNYGSS